MEEKMAKITEKAEKVDNKTNRFWKDKKKIFKTLHDLKKEK